MYYILYFLAGMLAANGVPHFIKGITGEQHQTPFGNPSTAVMNVTWGSFNLAVAWGLWHYAGLHRALNHTVRYEIVFGVGAFLVAIMLAKNWSQKAARTAK
jgi:hypothetical protein